MRRETWCFGRKERETERDTKNDKVLESRRKHGKWIKVVVLFIFFFPLVFFEAEPSEKDTLKSVSNLSKSMFNFKGLLKKAIHLVHLSLSLC